MFVLLGLLATPSRLLQSLWPALGVAAALMFVARPLAVWLCLLPFRFSPRETLFIAWVGLRGAVPIVLAMFPLLAGTPHAVLLFAVGLKLDLHHVRHIGTVALATGLGQLGFTIVIGFALILALGKGWVEALYVAVALTFSSTIIIVKLLSDKREIDALHGRISLGILIVQDVAVVLAMVVASALGAGDAVQGSGLGWMLGGALAMAAVVWVFVRWLAVPLLARIATSPELVVIFAVGWAAGFAALADAAGLGQELGGLAAGVSLASTPGSLSLIHI